MEHAFDPHNAFVYAKENNVAADRSYPGIDADFRSQSIGTRLLRDVPEARPQRPYPVSGVAWAVLRNGIRDFGKVVLYERGNP